MSNKIYSYGKQSIDASDIDAVLEILKSDWLTQGPTVKKFEEALAEKFGAGYVSAVSNGTAALHLTALALNWKPGDIVLTTPITFLASANSIIYSGATPDFVDIDEKTYTISIPKLKEKLRSYDSQGKKIKAVVAVDYAGHPCDWEALKQLADEFGFQLVNDNCHALGAEYKNNLKYAVDFADVAIQSFHPVKHITTGEGGAVLTNNKEIDEKIKILRTHGMTKDVKYLEQNDGPWYYEMHWLGYNYRITDFQCALGISQLNKLDAFVKRRREIAEFYNATFGTDENFIIPYVDEKVKHAYHLYPLQIKFDKLEIDKRELFLKLKERNIYGQVHYIPVHLQPYYKKKFGYKKGDFPVAEKFYEREISIPMYPSLTDEDLKYIAETFFELVK